MVGIKNSKTPKKSNPTTPKPAKSNPSTPKPSTPSANPAKKPWKTYALIGLLGLTVLALAITLIVILVAGKKRNVCETPECISLAQQLHNWKDESVDPCQDFFKYTCGKYNEYSTSGGALRHQGAIVSGLIKEFLTKKKFTFSKSEQAMHTLYGKCMETGRQSGSIDANFKSLYDKITSIGSWPSIDSNWPNAEYNLEKLLTNLAIFDAENSLISLGIFSIQIPHAPKIVIIGNHQQILWYDENMKNNIVEFMERNGITPNVAQIETDLRDVATFATALSKLFKPEKDEDVTSFTGYSHLRNVLPYVDFDKIINSLVNPRKNTAMIIKSKIRINKLLASKSDELLNLIVYTGHRTVANYLFSRFFFKAYTWNSHIMDNDCEDLVTELLPHASIRWFIRNHFDKDSLKSVSDLVENIRESFVKMLESSTWMSASAKTKMAEKAKAMKKIIGYPEEFEKPGALDKIFDLYLDPSDTYYTMTDKITRYRFRQMMEFASGELTINPMTLGLITNAHYIMTENSLTILAPIIDDPLFHASYPTYAKLAGVGYILGHEIGHGFDNGGVIFDKNGDFNPIVTIPDYNEYMKKMQCLIKQYDNYNDPDYGRKLNGTFTISENLPDGMAADVIWRAFKALDMSAEPKIVGFEDYSDDKLFYQIAALNWCSPRSSLPLARQLMDTHATHSFRVNGVFANQKTFADAYQCKEGSPMNPVNKCTIF